MTDHPAAIAERERIVAYLDRMKTEASELGFADAVFWIVQVKRNIKNRCHLTTKVIEAGTGDDTQKIDAR